MGSVASRQLVLNAQKGDRGAFESLARAHYGRVYAVCLDEMGNPLDAEDLAQEALVRAHRDLRGLRDPSKFLPWLRRLTRNLCKMEVRRRVRTASEEEATRTEAKAGAASHDPTSLRLLLYDALGSLSETTRVPLSLHYFGGQSYRDIASALGVRESTIRSRIYEGRKQLRSRLKGVVGELLRVDQLGEGAINAILSRCGGRKCSCSDRLMGG